jgi:hypothetical protein
MDIELDLMKDGEPTKVSGDKIGRSIKSAEQFAAIVSANLNNFGNPFQKGKDIGVQLQRDHRTNQRSEVLWALGVLVGLADQEYTDARNEEAIASAKKVRQLIEDGTLKFGLFV